MEQRKRNTAFLLIAAGLFLLLGKVIGFFTVVALFVVWLGIYKIRHSEEKVGYLLVGIGCLMIIGNHLSVIISVILISLGYFYIKSKRVHRDDSYYQKQSFLESIKWDKDPWVVKNMSIWSVIGETHIDLSIAMLEEKETTLILQGVIGDVDIIVPEDVGVSVNASVLFGQIDVDKEKESGVLNRIVWRSPDYEGSEHKVKLLLSYIVGDINIKIL